MKNLTKEEQEYEKDKQELKRIWLEILDLIRFKPFPLMMIITLIFFTIKLLAW